MSFFNHLEMLPPDPIFGLVKAFQEDKNPNKADLTVGIYYNEDLKPEVLKVVKEAEKALVDLEKTKTYLPIDGDQFYLEGTLKLLFGEDLASSEGYRTYCAQSVGGTGALRVVAQTLKEFVTDEIYIPAPTWPNHLKVFKSAGLEVKTYPYYNNKSHQIEFEEMLKTISKIKEGSAILFHGCCHNPTGKDPTKQQWEELSKLILEKKLIPVFDVAYQGFGESLDEDAWAVRHFVKAGHELFACYSYSKIFGLYAERVGAVFAVTSDEKTKKILATNVKPLIRGNYSNPPKHGASIVSYVLHHEILSKSWRQELELMRVRIVNIRNEFSKLMQEKCPDRDYRYIDSLKGLFCLTGLSKEQVLKVIEDYGVYMTYGGRINLTGLNHDNIEYVTDSISKVLKQKD